MSMLISRGPMVLVALLALTLTACPEEPAVDEEPTPLGQEEGELGETGQPEEEVAEDEGNPCGPDGPGVTEEDLPPAPEGDAEVVQVTAVDYAFQGVDDTYAAGQYGFEFRNDGDELHEMVVFRIDEEEQRPVEELLQLPQEEAQGLVEQVTGSFACPGEEAPRAVAADLTEPGRYAMVCFVPTGFTAEVEDPATLEDAEPHFAQGMYTEFTVE